jgi:hypothetical protein
LALLNAIGFGLTNGFGPLLGKTDIERVKFYGIG